MASESRSWGMASFRRPPEATPGGWRIVRTMGSRITRLSPQQGFCAETGGAITRFLATHVGVPVATTHTITNILWAWVITLSAAAIVGAESFELARLAQKIAG